MRVLALATTLFAALVVSATAGSETALLRAAPPHVEFGMHEVGTVNLKGTKITNTSDRDVLLIVEGYSMPDEFGFGLMPGSTCPALGPALLAAGESCHAVMSYRPDAFFVESGFDSRAALIATATDPATDEVVGSLIIEFSGRGRL